MSLGRTLVLNAAAVPVEVCEAEDAIWDVMKGSAFVVEGTGEFCRSPTTSVEIPSVIQQYIYHAPKTPSGKPRSLPLTPRNICARDRWVCAYQIEDLCQGRATTIDHVVPRAQGGENTWENCVAACRACNHRKGNRTPEQMGWELKIKPWRPTGALARVIVHAGHRPEWLPYLK